MLLAEHTTEATRIEVHNGLVYKFLRSLESSGEISPAARRRQYRLRAAESQRWPEINPIVFDEARHCLISPYLIGRLPTRQELCDLRRHLAATGRGYVEDIGRNNVIVVDNKPIVIDFHINDQHADFVARYGKPPPRAVDVAS
jgi:hypothetical protein